MLKNIEKNNFQKIKPLFKFSEYKGYKNFYSWLCLICNKKFKDNLGNFKIPRCPNCFPFKTSIFQEEIVDFLKNFNIEINVRNLINPKEIDIYIPEYNLAIECNGIYWHSELNGKNKNYHLDKTNMCEKIGIRLIHIFEDEWVEKPEQIKSYLLNILNKPKQIIYARKCKIKEVSYTDSINFYEKNHLQGKSILKINIGLYYENELVALISFGSPRFNKNYEWEIIRFCNKLYTKVIGSFPKLFKYFLSKYNPISIITYADKRLFTGAIYEKNEFEFLKDSSPNYYYTDYKQRFNRINFQKHKLKDKLKIFTPDLTEWENMKNNNYDRIWDCGNKVFVYKKAL